MLNANLVAPDTVRPISRQEYEKMVGLGLFEDERVELIDGVVLCMSPEGAPHGGTIQRLTQILVLALHPRAAVRVQSAFAASDGSEPEPDVAVVPAGDYDDAHPSEAYLIIEVADTSLAKDRGVKAALYAQSGVPEYWVVNLPGKLIEIYTDIVQGAYTHVIPYRKGETVRLQQFPDIEIRVESVLRE
jgi:Uma2 family endonuclease